MAANKRKLRATRSQQNAGSNKELDEAHKLEAEVAMLFKPTITERKELATDHTLLKTKGFPISDNSKDEAMQEATELILKHRKSLFSS